MSQPLRFNAIRLGAVACIAFVGACDGGVITEPVSSNLPSAAIVSSSDAVEVQNFKVCKVGTDADFTFTVNDGAATAFSLAAGECASIHQYAGWPPDQVSVTELAQAGVQLDSIILTRKLGGGPISITTTKLTGTNTASGQIEFEEGWVATFYNSPIEVGEGCTPGYWKNHLESWPVDPDMGFDATFGVDLFSPDITLEMAVNRRGGQENKLARHGTAAYLSAQAGINYPYTVAEVINFVQHGLSEELVEANELGCPLN